PGAACRQIQRPSKTRNQLSLMQLIMTDERLYRDGHVVSAAAIAQARGNDPVHGDNAAGSRYFVERGVLQRFETLDTAQLGRPPSM
ncbi:hypothetical protein BZM27_55765, partial [Paraburkholderia steynii]